MNNKLLGCALFVGAIMTTSCAHQDNIMALQETASQSLLSSTKQVTTRTVTGVISAIVIKPLNKKGSSGFYLQDKHGDNNPLTSDGIFVAASTDSRLVGEEVSVTGTLSEQDGLTTLRSTTVTLVGPKTSLPPTPLRKLESDSDFAATLARHDGMLVTIDPQSEMFVSRSYGFDYAVRRNNMALSYGDIAFQANQQHIPSSAGANKQARLNDARNLTIESLTRSQRGKISWYPHFAKSTENQIRVSDRVEQLTGVVSYLDGQYRLLVTEPANHSSFVPTIPRTTKPNIKLGDIKVATFNVLNYFNSPFGGDANPQGQSRGARTQKGFELQAAKIVKAIAALDADIIGLMEIENNGFGNKSALVDLVNRINKQLPAAQQYQFAEVKGKHFIGTGAITNQVIYRPSTVSVEKMTVIEMPQQHAPRAGKESGINFMRDTLAPTFLIKKSGAKLTVSVNHFKSKGSTCWEDVALQNNRNVDRQGSCENFRVSGAYHLGQQMAKIEGHKLIIGDLNSYAGEDPVTVLTNRNALPSDYKITAARDTFIGGNQETGKPLHGSDGFVVTKSFGYLNTVKAAHPRAFGYSFKNVVGTLDYILASPSLKNHIVDAIEWNINSPESTLLEYPSRYTGEMVKFRDPYRSSDHDPVIISLKF